MTYGDADYVPIVLGTGLNSYALARALHEAYGVRTLAIGRFPLRETADSAIIDVRTFPDLNRPERLVEVLEAVAKEFAGRKLLLIANVEYYIGVVMEHRTRLERHFVLPLVPTEVAHRLLNKADFYRTCEELGVAHPVTRVVNKADVATGLGGDLPFDFPVIVKPSDTDVWGRMQFPGKRKVYLAADGRELQQIADSIYAAGYDDELIVQEYLVGGDAVMRVVNAYSDRHGRMRALSAAQVVLSERNPQTLGNYNALVTVHDAALTEQIRHLLDSVGYVGPANFDVMIDRRTGTSKLLEVNLRLGAASYYAAVAGVNLARCFVEDFVHEQEIAEQISTEQRLWINVPRWAVRTFVAKDARPLVAVARRKGATHTLVYRNDSSIARRTSAARVSWRHALDLVRYRKNTELGGATTS